MKPGYHSTQSKMYNRIPRSEFYGFVLGYAVGTIIRGVFNLQSNTLQLGLAVIGLGIGVWWDRKFYMVKDEPENEALPEGEEGAEDGGPGTGEAIQKIQSSDADDEPGDGTGSMQQRLKKMFEKHNENSDEEQDEEQEKIDNS